MTRESMLDRVARYPAWLALAMMAPFAALVIAAAVTLPPVACRHACSVATSCLATALAEHDVDSALPSRPAQHVSARVHHRLIRIPSYPL